MQLNDNQFFTKLGYQIDTRIFRWLQQCESDDDRATVDDELVNYKPIVNQILNDQFFQFLPSIFKQKDQDDDELAPSKKKPKKNQEESRLDKNTGRIPSWDAASNEDYQKFFAGKHLNLRPNFKGRPMC